MDMHGFSRNVMGQWISLDTIELHLRGTQREEILQALVDKVPEIAGQPTARQTLLRALQEREQLCSTGIGDGIALPHARNALVGLVDHPVIVMGRHDTGIPFGAIDGAPARLFFLLVAPTVSQHLQVLARLSRLLSNVKVCQELFRVDRPEKALALLREAENAM